MELLQPITAVKESSTLVAGTPAVSCLERLQLVAHAATDRTLRRESVAVLAQLALYVNSDSGTAWPAQQTLGERLGMSRQNVNRALRQLEALGYVLRSHEAPRLVYRLQSPEGVVTGDYRSESPVTTGGESPVIHKPGKVNPVTEPGEESPTVIPGGSPGGTGRPSARQVSRAPAPTLGYLPDDWQPSERAVTVAMAELQLTREQVAHQTTQFRSYQRSNPKRSADWLEDWRRFLENVRPGGPQRWRVEPGKGRELNPLQSNRGNPARITDLAAWGYRE